MIRRARRLVARVDAALNAMEADAHLVADLINLNTAMPEKTKATAREVVNKVVRELLARLEQKTAEAVRGALNRSKRTRRPRFGDVDWAWTIRANLRHYQPKHRTVVPESLVGFARCTRTLVDLDEVVLCVDQSGSMATNVVYSSIFAAVMASLPSLDTKLACFDTRVVNLTLEGPVGVQLGGGTVEARHWGWRGGAEYRIGTGIPDKNTGRRELRGPQDARSLFCDLRRRGSAGWVLVSAKHGNMRLAKFRVGRVPILESIAPLRTDALTISRRSLRCGA